MQMTLLLKKPIPGFNPVDVRDVAKAHILAAEAPEAHGRSATIQLCCPCTFLY